MKMAKFGFITLCIFIASCGSDNDVENASETSTEEPMDMAPAIEEAPVVDTNTTLETTAD